MVASTRTIPVLDLHAIAEEGEKISDQLGAELDSALRDDGFVSIVGHGISADLIAEMHKITDEFFRLPPEEKLRYSGKRAHEGGRRGYHPMRGSSARILGLETPPDLRETYSMSRPGTYTDILHPEDAPDNTEGRIFQLWPEEPQAMRDIWVEYYGALERLSHQLLCVMAIALGLEEDWFEPYWNDHASTLSANYYPAIPESEIEPNQMRIGPHTDGCGFVVLYQDMTPSSLQIADHGNLDSWRDVVPTPESFVVNLGDTIAYWTDELWASTVHRAIVPSGENSSRISIAFRFSPKEDAVLSSIPGINGHDGSSREPITPAKIKRLRPSTY